MEKFALRTMAVCIFVFATVMAIAMELGAINELYFVWTGVPWIFPPAGILVNLYLYMATAWLIGGALGAFVGFYIAAVIVSLSWPFYGLYLLYLRFFKK